MEMLVQAGLLAAGFAMLAKGSGWFVDGAAGLAARLRISQLVIGLTVVAMGTSAPEAAVSISAALKGTADITVGNILGSNILNILIILGLSALITPLAVDRGTIRRELPFLIAVTLLLLVQGYDGTVSLWDGVLLLVVFAGYLAYLLATAKRAPEETPDDAAGLQSAAGSAPAARHGLGRLLLLACAGLAVTVAGSVVAVDAATAIARLLGLSERFIGLTIVALGTSLPELFTSATAAARGDADIAIGNIVGSNLFNLLFVIGVSALVAPVPFAGAFRFDALVSAAAAGLLLLCCAAGGKLRRWHGAALLAAYAGYFLLIL